MKRTTTAIACSAAALALGLSGCGVSFEGSGSKDAASAEQLALRADDPWAAEVTADGAARAKGDYADGVYVGRGRGMEGAITVTLLLDDGRITCLETTQEGESQSRGGYEAIRDGVYAEMIEAAQGADIDAIAGATITTAGVKQAVEDALAQAEAAAGAGAVDEVAVPGAGDAVVGNVDAIADDDSGIIANDGADAALSANGKEA